MKRWIILWVVGLGGVSFGAPWRAENSAWNVNQNPDGSNPAAYFGEWPGHVYEPSPEDWRNIPVYQFITDRFADGDPANNDGAYGGYNVHSVYDRHGGDFRGIMQRLDYIKSLGYKAIWISPVFQNRHNSYHGYGQIDFTLLDDRFGTLDDFRAMVDRAHELGLYVIVDIIVNHLSDLYHFEGYPGGNAPFRFHGGEYKLIPHNPGEAYEDFKVNNTFISEGKYCDVYDSQGWRVTDAYPGLSGSYWLSDLHHNGDLHDYGDAWQNHLGKIYGSLDDLRTSHPRVQDKIIAMTKALVASTDIDGIRMDTPMQVPLYFFKRWVPAVKEQATALGKTNFFIFGEFYCERGRASTMVGRGKEPSMQGNPNWFISDTFTMDGGINYPLYWSFFQPAVKDQVNGNLQNLQESYWSDWYAFDHYKPTAGENRYYQLNFYNNHDQWRMSVAPDGLKKTGLGSAIIAFWPGIPLFYYGDEQGFCTYGTALDGWSREDMMTSLAWNDVPSVTSPNPARGDNFNMTHSAYQYVQKCMNLRQAYPALRVTDYVVERWKQPNNMNGIYAFSRIWGGQDDWALVVFNTWKDALMAGGNQQAFHTGWNQGDVLVNVMDPSETVTLGPDGTIGSLWVGGYQTKVFVRQGGVKALNPVVTAVFPGHDEVVAGDYTVRVFFSEPMNEAAVKQAFRFDGEPVSEGHLHYDANRRELTYTVSVPDGIHQIALTEDARSLADKPLIGPFRSRFRTGGPDNILVNSGATTDPTLIASGAGSVTNRAVSLHHKAAGAEKFRVVNEGEGWSDWQTYTPVTDWTLAPGAGEKSVTVQYWADGSAAYFVQDSILLNAGLSLTSVDGIWHYPFSGQLDAGEDLWINADTRPAGQAASVTVEISLDGGTTWTGHGMLMGAAYGDRDWWHLNLGSFAPLQTIQYRIQAVGLGGEEITAGQDGAYDAVQVNPGPPVQWIGHHYHYPFAGDIDATDDFWVNVESWPKDTAISARVVYSLDGGTTWNSTDMVKAGVQGNNDWWHLNVGTLPAGTTIRYAIEVKGGDGGSKWDTNGGGDYFATVNP